MHISFKISVFLLFPDIYPGVEFLGVMVVLVLIFSETSVLFSIVAVPIYIATHSVQRFPFLHILANICYLVIFDESHSDRCEMIAHYGFDLQEKGTTEDEMAGRHH